MVKKFSLLFIFWLHSSLILASQVEIEKLCVNFKKTYIANQCAVYILKTHNTSPIQFFEYYAGDTIPENSNPAVLYKPIVQNVINDINQTTAPSLIRNSSLTSHSFQMLDSKGIKFAYFSPIIDKSYTGIIGLVYLAFEDAPRSREFQNTILKFGQRISPMVQGLNSIVLTFPEGAANAFKNRLEGKNDDRGGRRETNSVVPELTWINLITSIFVDPFVEMINSLISSGTIMGQILGTLLAIVLLYILYKKIFPFIILLVRRVIFKSNESDGEEKVVRKRSLIKRKEKEVFTDEMVNSFNTQKEIREELQHLKNVLVKNVDHSEKHFDLVLDRISHLIESFLKLQENFVNLSIKMISLEDDRSIRKEDVELIVYLALEVEKFELLKSIRLRKKIIADSYSKDGEVNLIDSLITERYNSVIRILSVLKRPGDMPVSVILKVDLREIFDDISITVKENMNLIIHNDGGLFFERVESSIQTKLDNFNLILTQSNKLTLTGNNNLSPDRRVSRNT